MHTVVETPTFLRKVEKLLSEDSHVDLIEFLARNPLAGDSMPDTGGVRNGPLCRSWQGQVWRRPGDLLRP